MSSILKALKKLENENNARTPDSLKINAEILRGSDSRRFSSTGIVLAALLLFLCGGVAMYLFMKPVGNKPASASLPIPVERIVPAAIVPAAPLAPSRQPMPIVIPRKASVTQQLIEKPKQSSTTIPPAAALKGVKNKPRLPQHSAKHALSPATSSQPVLQEIPIVTARPVVRVNGIAFQDGSDSVAVINGIAVSRGAVIEGVKVEEIQRDRVQFSFGGEKFEISLGKSNQ